MDEAIRRSVCAVCLAGEISLVQGKDEFKAKRRKEQAAGTLVCDEKFDDLIQFMDNAATGIDARPEKLAVRTLILTLASSHTTSMAAFMSGALSDVRTFRVHSFLS